jgi:uncharacterized membrane protein (DUF4010 family)
VNSSAQWLPFAQSLALGLLIGVERERHPDARAGLRTFALIALAGTVFAVLADSHAVPWLLPAGLLAIAALLIAAHAKGASTDADPGATTTVAGIVTYGLGALLALGHSRVAIAVAVVVTLLLYLRAVLHGATRRLSARDLGSFLQFAALTFVLLPILPDVGFGPYAALNPYRIGFFAALISGLSLAGYVGLRLLGAHRGRLLIGALGGLVSTTATTVIFSRHTRRDPTLAPLATVVILVANLVLFLRLAVLALVVAPSTALALLPMLVLGASAGAAYVAWCTRHCGPGTALPELPVDNPAELRAALGFAALFALVMLLVAALNARFGAAGVFAAAALSGLTDLDAISISALRLTTIGALSVADAATTLAIAYFANLAVKFAIAFGVGSPALGRHVGAGFAIGAAGLLAGWLGMQLWNEGT